MSIETCSTMPVFLEEVSIEIGGTKLPATSEGEVHFTHTYYPARNMHGRMEDAEPSHEEVELDEVELTITLYGSALGSDEEHCIQFVTNQIEFYEEHFGHLDCEDVNGYI